MGLEILDFIIILSYFILVLIVGFMLSTKARKNLDQYFLGGNKIKRNGDKLLNLKGGKWKGYFHVPRALLILSQISKRLNI